jgi:hypothetical protein
MSNYLKALAFLSIALFSLSANAHQVNLKLVPQASKLIENKYIWSLNATCKIQCNESKNKIMVRVVKNKGIINGKNLSGGQATSVVVHNHDSITVSAEPGAQVNLLNLGTDVVQATCST